jgi:hypothetical protein
MSELGELANQAAGASGDKACIFCGEQHKQKEEHKPANHTFPRKDVILTREGRAYIKTDPLRSSVYPKDEAGNFVSPLEEPRWPEDHIFKTYKSSNSGRTRRYPREYQSPPILGYVAEPHHMVAVCCMNGTNRLPAVPRVNPWAFKAGYDINGGKNCIFLPSSASQFYVAYYYWKVRKTGQALQGHLGNHRKEYFEEIWNRLEQMAEQVYENQWCADTSTDEKQRELADRLKEQLHILETTVFSKLAALRPEENFRLGAETYIEIPNEALPFQVPAGVQERLMPYETLPQWNG